MKQLKHIETWSLLKDNPEKGIEILYERYGKKLFGYGVSSWKLSEDESWEMVYQTLYKVMEKLSEYSFENEKKFGSFIFTVFCNFLRRHYRDSKRISEYVSFSNFSESLMDEARFDAGLGTERKVAKFLKDKATEEIGEGEREENILMQHLEEALDQLEDWQRILLLQRSIDRPYQEIAEFIGKPVEQLKVYYQRARVKLEKILSQRLETETHKQRP